MSSLNVSGLPVPESLIPYLTGELEDYSSLQGSIYTFNITFAVLVVLALCLRMFVRLYLIRAAGPDDVLMVMAVFSSLMLFSACLSGAHNGLGKHIWNLDSNLLNLPGEASHITKILFACYILYATAITFTKCSIIASYIRLFPHNSVRRISYATGFIVIAFWVCQLFAMCFSCYPIQALWDWTIVDAKCFPIVNFFYVAAAFSIATDVILCVIPLPTLWSLKMPKAQRLVVSILFSFGIFACVCSTLRLTQLHNLTGVDLTYQTVSPLNWSAAEVGAAIVCACLSAMRPLASKVFPNFFFRFGQTTSPSLNSFTTQRSSNDTIELIHQHPDPHQTPS